MAEIRELWKVHSIAEDNRDLPGLISTLTEDCVYTVAGTGVRWEGHEGAARFYTELLTAFPDIHFDLDYIVIGPQGVCEEAIVTATHDGTLARPRAHRRAPRVAQRDLLPWDPAARKFKGEMVYTDLVPRRADARPVTGTPRRAGRSQAAATIDSPVDLDVVFLGTSGSAPTAQRATSATLIRRGGERLLVDCGEGTQRQLLRSDVGLVDLEHVFLTHFHADHYLGLPGMLKTFALRGREVPLTLYGPPGLRELLAVAAAGLREPDLPGRDGRARARATCSTRGGYEIRAFAVDHGSQALGYVLAEAERPGRFDVGVGRRARRARRPRARRAAAGRGRRRSPTATTVRPEQVLGPARPGRSLALTGDTAPAASVVDAAAGVDLLVHEATFCADERDRARETQHSTAAEAALAAQAAGVRLLALTHISSRYFGGEVAEEARQLFPDTVVPRDFDVDRDPVPRARRARARAARRAARPRPAARHRPGVVSGAAGPTSAPAPASTTPCGRPTRPGGRHSTPSSSSATSAAGECSTSAAARAGSPPRSSSEAHAKVWGVDASEEMVAVARETRACRRRGAAGGGRASCRSATAGSTASRCRSSSTSSTGRGRSPRRAAS